MSQGKIRRALSFWVWGWPALVLFAPIGFLWLLGWSIWLLLKITEDRQERKALLNRITPGSVMHIHAEAPRVILHDGHWMTPEQAVAWESGDRIRQSNSGAYGLFQFMPDDWPAMNARAAYQARMRNAATTGLDENGDPL